MRRILLPFLTFLLTLPAGASITGVVVNSDGQPVAGARVSLCAPETIEARRERLMSKAPVRPALATLTSDSKGTFTFDSPKDHPVVDVDVEANGFAPDAVRLLADDDAGAIALVSAPMERGTITANGKPVAGATVVWMGSNTDYVATTDAAGHYTVPNPSRWANRLAIAHPDYAIDQEMIRNEVKSLDRTLNSGVAISGHVVGQDGQTPAAKASLLVDDLPQAATADDGSFTIAHAPRDWQEVEGRSGELAGMRARTTQGVLSIRLAKLGTISGTVLDAKTQLPLVSAEVRLGPDTPFGRARGLGAVTQNPAIASVLTDSKGAFTITAPPGRYDLTAIYPSSTISNTAVTVLAGQKVNKSLYGSANARVTGTVIDDQKQPVAGARLATRNAARGGGAFMMMLPRFQQESTAVSGPDGRFALRNVTTETDLHVDANKKGLPSASSAVLHLKQGERKSGVVLTIPRGVAFAGRVTDNDARPLSGVSVEPVASDQGGRPQMIVRRVMRMMGRNRNDDDIVHTGSDGAFSMRLKEGTYDVVFQREGFAGKTLRAQAVSATAKPVTVKLDPAVEISGRVVRGGAGIDGVNINVIGDDANGQAVTGPDGSFTVSDLSPGQVMLTATKPDAFIQQIRSVNAPAQGLTIEVPSGGRISGRVVDKTNNVPVTTFQAGISTSRSAGPMSIVTPPMLKQFTADDGTFVLENVPPGPTELVVSAPGFSTQHVPGLNVEDGKTLGDVEVDLQTGARVSGRVTAMDGTPLSGVAVNLDTGAGGGGRIIRFGGTDNSATTDPNGEYTIDSIDPGQQTFTFTRQGYVSASRSVNVTGSDSRLDVQLSSGISLSGLVVTDAGAPVADAQVTARSASDASFGRQVQTDSGGQFQIGGVAPGHYTITASKSGLADGIIRDFDASSGGQARVVMITGGTITGHITGLTDAELQQTTVMATGPNGSAQAEVDGSGNYQITGAPTGTVRVSARTGGGLASGRSSTAQSVEVDPGSSVQVDLQFKSNTVISGHVTQNGQPVANAMIRFFPQGGQTQTNSGSSTDSNGAYQVTGLDDGPYTVSVIDIQGSSSFTANYTVSGSSTYDIAVKSSDVHGTVVDATTGDPVAGAQVQIQAVGANAGAMLNARTVQTDPSGAFIIQNVQSGSYQGTAQKSGYGHDLKNFMIGDTPPDDLQFKIAPSAGVTLNVVDGRDNTPLSANVIRVVDAQGNPVEQNGGFRFNSTPAPVQLTLAPGQYTVTLAASGYAPRILNVVSPSTQTVAMTPGGTLVLRSQSSVRQSVRLLMPNGAVYPRGMNGIFILDPAPLTTTLENVDAGNYTLQVLDSAGNITNTIPITVVDGQQNVVDV